MGCARAWVEVGGGFEDVHGDAVLGEEQGEEEAGGAGAYYEDLVCGYLIGAVVGGWVGKRAGIG